MKPESIRMQAFGPYLKETFCDFTPLYAARLFLITGPTGGGKTTILDAMSFALYGKATGNLRSFADMRSISAPDDLDTEAEFIFTLGDCRYKFLRRYHIHQKRTGGREEQITAECHRYEKDGWALLASGAEKVTKAAAELLGFTHSQFSQVIVLPQGEFRRLLLASSKEKLEILQVLFATSVWQQVAAAAAERLKRVKEELETLQTGRAAQLEAAGVESPEALAEACAEGRNQLESAQKAAKEAQAAFDQASNALEAAKSLAEKFDRLQGHRNLLSSLQRQDEKMDELRRRRDTAQKARELLPYLQQKMAAEEGKKAKRQAREEAETALQAARTAYTETLRKCEGIPTLRERQQMLREKAAGIAALLPDAARLDELAKEVLSLKHAAEEARQQAEKQNIRVRNLIDRIENGEKYIKNLYESHILPQPQLQQKLTEAAEAVDNLRRRAEGMEAIAGLQAEKAAADRRLDTALKLLSSKEAIAERLEKAFRENAAAELAATLSEGSPCPVCGATHHPAPHTGGAVGGHDRLEETRAAVKKAREEADACRQTAAGIAAKLQAAEESLRQADAACAGLQVSDIAAAEKQLAAAKSRLEEAQTKGASYGRYQESLEGLKKEREEAQEAATAAEGRRAELSNRLAALSASQQDILRKLPAGMDLEQLKSAERQAKEQADSLQIRIQSLEKDREEQGAELSRREAAAAGAREAFKEADERYLDAHRELERAAMAAGLSPEADLGGLMLEPAALSDLETRIRQHETTLRLTGEKIAELEEALAGKERPDAESAALRKQEAAAALSQAVERQGRLSAHMQQLETAAERLSGFADEQARLDKEYGRVARVSDFIGGKNPHRTPLHGFILGLMLDEVVEAASRYLSRLSRGRYQLVRVDAQGGVALRGLDIEVIDAHTGGQRRVCTLSGGELFLASLSLAFGLAEVVQAYAGGVTLDSIFIDEGFGSLDAETLEAAMKALADIQKEGRLVGLISHVSELRNRIPARIEVVPGRDGSTLEVKPL